MQAAEGFGAGGEISFRVIDESFTLSVEVGAGEKVGGGAAAKEG